MCMDLQCIKGDKCLARLPVTPFQLSWESDIFIIRLSSPHKATVAFRSLNVNHTDLDITNLDHFYFLTRPRVHIARLIVYSHSSKVVSMYRNSSALT